MIRKSLPGCSSKPLQRACCHSTRLQRQPRYRQERRLTKVETTQPKWIAIVFLAVSLAVRNFRHNQS
jgi:hypothetical protein